MSDVHGGQRVRASLPIQRYLLQIVSFMKFYVFKNSLTVERPNVRLKKKQTQL